jgi:hypothetical protein
MYSSFQKEGHGKADGKKKKSEGVEKEAKVKEQ